MNTLHGRFLRVAAELPDRPALVVDGDTLSYAALKQRACAVAATLQRHRASDGVPMTCVLGARSAAGFEGILGALCSGHAYVPMLPSYPAARLAMMIDRSEARALVVDEAGCKQLAAVLPKVARPLTVLLAAGEVSADVVAANDRHRIIARADFESADTWQAPEVDDNATAYLLFTSGSTGEPKGVMVAHRNIARFLDVVTERYQLTEHDRFSHVFEVTFDLSLFDLFGAWTNGACLCVPDARQRMLPATYVVDSALTVWFSVPSTALLMKDTRTLVAGAFPGLRVSLFCGEALTMAVAEAWAEAAPASVVDNLYGPTELTLACTEYRLHAESRAEAEGDVVPIGQPLPQMRAKVVDESLHEVGVGDTGELIMAGPQVALGYWRDEARTAAAFVTPPGEREVFYRTGDRVRRPSGDGPLLFLGRMDHQVKIRGFRVELGEVEAALRDEASVDSAVALGWPRAAAGGAEGIVAFIDDASVDTRALKRRLADRLPRYMLPKTIRVIDAFPLNANGKIDRNALAQRLEAAASPPSG
ncbi:MAG: amino acid adenylation domain-containing protein [Myxococcota bacterium]